MKWYLCQTPLSDHEAPNEALPIRRKHLAINNPTTLTLDDTPARFDRCLARYACEHRLCLQCRRLRNEGLALAPVLTRSTCGGAGAATGGISLMGASRGAVCATGAGLLWCKGGYGNCGGALYELSVGLDVLWGGPCVGEYGT